MKVCFIGHRQIEQEEKLICDLKKTIIYLINKGATTFLFGSMSDFDDLCWKIVTELKKEYPNIKRIYVRSSFQHISKSYEDMLLTSYEETYFPKSIENAGRFSYVERNFNMINNSTYCVFYYNKNYLPQFKKRSKRDIFSPSRRKSGTKIAYEYAISKRKQVINMYK